MFASRGTQPIHGLMSQILIALIKIPKSPFFTMWTSYRIETKIKNDEKSLPSSPATVVGYYVWNQELSKYEISKEKYNADLEEGYIETSIDRSQNKF